MRRRDDGWAGVSFEAWQDHDDILRRLAQGADPEADEQHGEPPLYEAASFGSPEVVAELARRVADVDRLWSGRTALWQAVVHNRPGNARALAAAGADPWRPLMGGWSPGRLSLTGPAPQPFTVPDGEQGLTDAELAAVQESRRLDAALGHLHTEGLGLACVAGIDAEEAVRRLEATPAKDRDVEGLVEDLFDCDVEEAPEIVGVTTVPGGCVVTQPWGYAPEMPGVMTRLSTGTVCYGLYVNPKSGDQGNIVRDGALEQGCLSPGRSPDVDDTPEEVLACYLYQHNSVAYACAFAGLRLTDARPVDGPPDMWVELPERDYWTY